MKVLWLKIVETSGARIYILLIGIATLFITARLLGPGGRGVFVLVITWVSLFAAFAGLSLGQVSQHRIQEMARRDWLPGTLGTLAGLCVILSLVAVIVAYLLFKLSGGTVFKGVSAMVLAIGFTMLPFLIWEEYGSLLLPAAGMLRAYNVSQFIGRTAGVCAIVLLVYWFKLGVPGAVLSQVVGQAIVAFLGFRTLKRFAGKSMCLDRREAGKLLKGASKLHMNTVGTFLLWQANVLMLSYFTNQAEIGWYQLALQMITMMLVVPQAASIVLFSRMAEIGPDAIWPEQKRLGLQVLGIMVLLSIAAYFLAPLVIPVLAGPSFQPSVRVFQLLLPVLIGLTLAQLMSNQWIGRGIFVPASILTFATTVANVVINLFTIPRYGMLGAVWSMIISFTCVAFLVQVYFVFYCEGRWRRLVVQSRGLNGWIRRQPST